MPDQELTLDFALKEIARKAELHIAALEAENTGLREALNLGLPLVELYAKQLEPSIAAILAGWAVGARAALEYPDGQ